MEIVGQAACARSQNQHLSGFPAGRQGPQYRLQRETILFIPPAPIPMQVVVIGHESLAVRQRDTKSLMKLLGFLGQRPKKSQYAFDQSNLAALSLQEGFQSNR